MKSSLSITTNFVLYSQEFPQYIRELHKKDNQLFKKHSIIPNKGLIYSSKYKGFLILPIYDDYPVFGIPTVKVKSISAVVGEVISYIPVMYLDNFTILQAYWPHNLKEFLKIR